MVHLSKLLFYYNFDKYLWTLSSAGQSNRLSAEGERSQGCGFAAELTSNRKVWAGLVVKKLNIVYLLWTLSSAGQSNRLITGRSWVRIPERPLFFCKTGILWKITGRNWIYFFQFNRLNAEGVRRQGCGLPQPWQVTGRSWVRAPERPLLFSLFQAVQYFAQQRHIIFVYRFSSILYIVLCAAVVLLYIKNNNSFLITYSPGNPRKFKVFDIIQRTNWLKQQDMQDLFNGQIGVSLCIKTIRNFRL